MSHRLSINTNLVEMEYAVRGPIPLRAAEMKRKGIKTIPCNIGNPQALGQKPISFYRQVLGLLEQPERIDRERALKELRTAHAADFEALGADAIPSDYVLDYARTFLERMETGMGAYTDSKGPAFIREAVAAYIDERDGAGAVPSDPDSIFITDGASEGASNILELLITGPEDGLMIPIPQYPLYSATIKRVGGVQVNYYPDEERGWALDRSILEESYREAVGRGVKVKGIVVINPANPTGAILDEQCVRDVVAFAGEHGLAVLADEVYQHNTYGEEFYSFARAVAGTEVPLFSLHSTSKGYYGECGHRGGYMELRNPPALEGVELSLPEVLLKQASVNLCSNTAGQALVYMMVKPPEKDSEPFKQFTTEVRGVLDDLHAKAVMIKDAFKKMDTMVCFGRIGAMYLFPRIGRLPAGKTDFDYCMSLLEQTGLCTVNGSGFGQKPGTHHLRIAFLPPKPMLEQMLPRWIDFHNTYVAG